MTTTAFKAAMIQMRSGLAYAAEPRASKPKTGIPANVPICMARVSDGASGLPGGMCGIDISPLGLTVTASVSRRPVRSDSRASDSLAASDFHMHLISGS